MSITMIRAGLMTTVQDLGRIGFQQKGVVVGGAMDEYSMRLANILVGNHEEEAVLETTLTGPTIQFEEEAVIAITGGDFQPMIGEKPLPMWRPVFVRKGEVITMKQAITGCRAYIAIAGGLAVPKVMGSRSTYTRAKIGGINGRTLRKGDMLTGRKLNEAHRQWFQAIKKHQDCTWRLDFSPFLQTTQQQELRVIRGTEYSAFEQDSLNQFFNEPYTVSRQSDRMGYRMEGSRMILREPLELISEAVTYGTIQIPSNGQPIILMADCQTTGGYPKIAQVISADLSNLAQLQPGATVTFREVSLEVAHRVYIKKEQALQRVKSFIRAQLF